MARVLRVSLHRRTHGEVLRIKAFPRDLSQIPLLGVDDDAGVVDVAEKP